MREPLIGYARVADDANDLTAQRVALTDFGVGFDRVYYDTGMAGVSRGRPGLGEALAACRGGAPWWSPRCVGWLAMSTQSGPTVAA